MQIERKLLPFVPNMVTTINSVSLTKIYIRALNAHISTALCRLVQHKLDYVVVFVYTLVPTEMIDVLGLGDS
jgi:hypothetical protein